MEEYLEKSFALNFSLADKLLTGMPDTFFVALVAYNLYSLVITSFLSVQVCGGTWTLHQTIT